MHAKLGAVTSHFASHEPLHSTVTSPPVQCADTSQPPLHCPSHVPCAFTSALQLKSTVMVTVTPAASAVLTRALRTPHASAADVFVVSSPRSAFIALHTVSHLASSFVAAA